MTQETGFAPLVDAVDRLRVSLDRDRERPGHRSKPQRLSEGAQVLALLPRRLRDEFTAQVPPSRMRVNGVRCRCDEAVHFEEGECLVPCPGGCGRTFLRLRTKVLVAQFAPPEPQGPCECENRRLLYLGYDDAVRCANCDGVVAEVAA